MMVTLQMLWLPILISALFVFVVSSLIHMFLPWHKNDYRKVPDEDKVMDALRPLNIPQGDYMVPRACSTKEMATAEFLEKMKKGPVLMLSVWQSGTAGMSKELILWVFIFRGHRHFHRLCLRSRTASRFPLSFSLQIRRYNRISRLYRRTLADVDLVPPALEYYLQDNC